MQERPGPWGVPPSGGVPADAAPAVVPLLDVDPTSASDAHLAAAWAARDPLALGEVYRRFSPMLYGVAACLVDDRAVAADAVHDAIVRAASRVGLLGAPSRLAVWLLALVRAEAAQHAAAPQPGRAPRPALEPALWRPDGAAPGDPLWVAAAALEDRDREVLELVARGLTDTRDLADVVGVSAQEAAMLVADMRVRLEASLGALLVARSGGDGCRGLGVLLASQASGWTTDVLALVVRHLQDCMDCRAVRSRLLATVPAVPAGPRHVLLDADLRARLMRTLGADGSGATPADRSTSWLVEAGTAGVGGWRWGWLDNGFPGRPPGAVRRVADVVADAEAAAAALVVPPPEPPHRRRVPVAVLALLLAVPVVLGGVVLAGAHPFGGDPAGLAVSASGGLLPGSVATGGSGRAPGAPGTASTGGGVRPGTTGTSGASGAKGSTSSAGGGASDVGTSGASGTSGSSVPVAGGSIGAPGTQPGGGSSSEGSEGGSSSGSSSSSSPPSSSSSSPAPAPVITGASVSPGTVSTPGGSQCKPLRATVSVTVAHASGVTGTARWSNGRSTMTTALSGSGGTFTASVGPFQVPGTYTVTIRVTGLGGTDSTTVSVDVAACTRG